MAKKPKRKSARRAPSASLVSLDADVLAAIRVHQQGGVDEAAQMYERVLARAPAHVDALHFLGMAEHQRGRCERALELIGRAAELAPSHPDIHNNRGNVLKMLKRPDEAEAAYRQVLALRPDDPNAMSNLGTVLRDRGELGEAEAVYRKVVALKPDHVGAYRNLGNVLSAQNRYAEALEAYREAMRLQPRAGESHQHLAAMFYAIGRIKDAEDIYERWLELEPDNPMPRHLLAGCTGQGVPARASNEFVRRVFDGFAPSFDRALTRLEYRAPELVAEVVREILENVPAPVDVLDAGCGTGLCAPLIKPHVRTLDGVDLSPAMIALARERALYDALSEAELTEFLRDRPAAYDLVVSADTLVYFGALDDVTRAATVCLRPSGHLVFTVERSDPEQAPAGYRIHPHGRYSHTERYLEQVLRAAPLEVVIMRPVTLRKEAGAWVNGTIVAARKGALATR